jgi:hypothetical protein
MSLLNNLLFLLCYPIIHLPNRHFHLGVTSRYLLQNIRKSDFFHIDATYKIIKYNFPLIVFGCTDIRRQFHVIAFMFTSHETEIDFTHFYNSLSDLCKVSNIPFSPHYMMQDADKAMANPVKAVFPRCKILMCYYHLRANVCIN